MPMRACVHLLLLTSSASAAETDPREWTTADVSGWVARVGLHEYRGAFGEGLVDGLRLLGLTLHELEHELLIPSAEHRMVIEMELGELKLRHGLLTPAERHAHLAAHPRTDEWSPADVQRFLEGQGLEAYAPNFAQLDGGALVGLSDAQLRRLATGGGSDEEDQATFELLAAQVKELRARTSRALAMGLRPGLKSEL